MKIQTGLGKDASARRPGVSARRSHQSGTAILAGFIVVMVVAVAIMGGCAAYRLSRRVDQINNQRATNDLYELTNSWNGFPTTPTNPVIIGICSVTMTSAVPAAITMRLETSTNLVDWETAVENVAAADADVTLSGLLNNPSNEPARFFRLMVRP
jgi:hypothetical protein